jgi:hypothetical protein
MKRKYHFVILLVLLGAVAFYFNKSYRFLYFTKPVNPGILVVEGWLSEDALQMACDEFRKNDYKLILTTGFPNGESVVLASFAKLILNFPDAIPVKTDSLYYITLKIKGTEAGGEFAHFRAYADSIELGDSYTTRRFLQYTYTAKLASPPDQIVIEFDNDFLEKSKDRNIIIDRISVNDYEVPVNTASTELFKRRNGTFTFKRKLSPSSAHDAAGYLVSAGIPDSLVVPIATSKIRKSKTFSTALDVNEWLNNNPIYSQENVNVFSQGIHSRRTWLSYHKVLSYRNQVGIITCPDPRFHPKNWWRAVEGWKEMLYETVGFIYVYTLL